MVKYESVWEVWVGDDMVEDMLDWKTASALARKYRKEEPADISVVIDEIRHYNITSLSDIDDVKDGKVEHGKL